MEDINHIETSETHENHNGPAFYRTTIRDGEIWAEGTGDTTEAAEAMPSGSLRDP